MNMTQLENEMVPLVGKGEFERELFLVREFWDSLDSTHEFSVEFRFFVDGRWIIAVVSMFHGRLNKLRTFVDWVLGLHKPQSMIFCIGRCYLMEDWEAIDYMAEVYQVERKLSENTTIVQPSQKFRGDLHEYYTVWDIALKGGAPSCSGMIMNTFFTHVNYENADRG
jgi:hypothetical protein